MRDHRRTIGNEIDMQLNEKKRYISLFALSKAFFGLLITQMSHAEILAVLAHELGHWKKGHIWKGLLLTETAALLIFYIVFVLLEQGWPAGAADLQGASCPARLTLILFMISLAAFPLTPLASLFSRRNEREADRFSCGLTGAPEALASALVKLSGENLANLHPHPLYAGFYYSHPPAVERVARLNHEATRSLYSRHVAEE